MTYNEIEPHAAQWLRNLIADGVVPAGDVLECDIREVDANVVADTAHFFAGIGVWAYALGLAGWDPARPVWTGSCPCQPFSTAGKQKGTEDERHVWPEFARLIRECRPPTIFGEQVASELGRDWFAGVRADLEALGYAVGCADLCAAGLNAPHIRQRLFWVADDGSHGRRTRDGGSHPTDGAWSRRRQPHADGQPLALADTGGERVRACGSGQPDGTPREDQGTGDQRQRLRPDTGHGSEPVTVVDADRRGRRKQPQQRGKSRSRKGGQADGHGPTCAESVGNAEVPGRSAGQHAGTHGPETGGGARLFGVGGSSPTGGLGDAAEPGSPQRGSERGSVRLELPAAERAGGATGGLADAERAIGGPDLHRRVHESDRADAGRQETHRPPDGGGADAPVRLDDAADLRRGERAGRPAEEGPRPRPVLAGQLPPGPQGSSLAGFWDAYAVLACRDGKARRTQPGLFPLVDGAAFRLADGRTRKDCSRAKILRGIGNAIVPWLAAAFVRAFLDAERD